MGTALTIAHRLRLFFTRVGQAIPRYQFSVNKTRRGYSPKYLDHVLGRIKVGGCVFTGRYVNTTEGWDTYLIMLPCHQLTPPYQVILTVLCEDCGVLVLANGCRCPGKPLPKFTETSLGSFAHRHFDGYQAPSKITWRLLDDEQRVA